MMTSKPQVVMRIDKGLEHIGKVVKAEIDAKQKPFSEVLNFYISRYQANFGNSEVLSRNAVFHAYTWATTGFQVIEPSHKLTASLMCTSFPEEFIDNLELPWSSFAVKIPDNVISNDEHFMWVHGISDGSKKVKLLLQTPGGFAHFSGTLSEINKASTDYWENSDQAKSRLEADRHHDVMKRLFIGVCAEVMSYRTSLAEGLGPLAKPVKRGPRVTNTFKLTRHVTVDVRQVVRDYIRGNGRSPTVQTLVRGHWKQQPCGAKLVDRKFIHVEPYWRGPETAPVAVRLHLIGS